MVHKSKILFDGVNYMCYETLMLKRIDVGVTGCLLRGKQISLRNTIFRTEGLRCIIVKYFLMG